MTETIGVAAPARAFLSALIDDASQYPPARLSLAASLAHYRANRALRHAWMIGRFVSPLSAREQLEAATASDELDVSLVCDVLAMPVRAGRLRVTSFEVAAQVDERGVADVVGALERVRDIAGQSRAEVFVEIPANASNVRQSIETLAALRTSANVHAKVRCGGLVASSAPSPLQLAAFIKACADFGLPLKATAGLHHPLRHFNVDSGYVMHGFLNVVGAALMASQRLASIELLRDIIACESPERFVFTERNFCFGSLSLNADEIARGRAFFRSFGSCSFSEPVDDLATLGILVH